MLRLILSCTAGALIPMVGGAVNVGACISVVCKLSVLYSANGAFRSLLTACASAAMRSCCSDSKAEVTAIVAGVGVNVRCDSFLTANVTGDVTNVGVGVSVGSGSFVLAKRTLGSASRLEVMLLLYGLVTALALVPMVSLVAIKDIMAVDYRSYKSASTVGIAVAVEDMLRSAAFVDLAALTLVPVTVVIVISLIIEVNVSSVKSAIADAILHVRIAMLSLRGSIHRLTNGACKPVYVIIVTVNGIAMLNLFSDLSALALVPVMSFIMIWNIEVVGYASYVSASTVGVAVAVKAMLDLLIDLSAFALVPVVGFIMIGNIEVVSDASYVSASTVGVAVTVKGMLNLLIDLSALALVPVVGFIMIGNVEVMSDASYVSASTVVIAIVIKYMLCYGCRIDSLALTLIPVVGVVKAYHVICVLMTSVISTVTVSI